MCTRSVWCCWKHFVAKSPFCNRLNKDLKNFVHWFKTCIRRKTIELVIDPFLIGKIAPKCLRSFISTAQLCLHFQGADRLSMDDVLKGLQPALHHQEMKSSLVRLTIHRRPSVHATSFGGNSGRKEAMDKCSVMQEENDG